MPFDFFDSWLSVVLQILQSLNTLGQMLLKRQQIVLVY